MVILVHIFIESVDFLINPKSENIDKHLPNANSAKKKVSYQWEKWFRYLSLIGFFFGYLPNFGPEFSQLLTPHRNEVRAQT